MREEPKKDMPVWAVCVFGGVVFVGVVILCYLGLWHTAERYDTSFALFDLMWPRIRHGKLCFDITITVMLVALCWFMWYGKTEGNFWKTFEVTIGVSVLIILTVTICCKFYANHLARQGIGTMQTELDTEYHQEEMKLMGNLGVYGGQLKLDDEPQFYVCRQIDTFGPFPEQLLEDTATQPFSEGYEEYSRFEQDGLVQFHALSVYHYQDGYWLVVKRFVDIRDLCIELESLDDLSRYIVQMQYSRYSGEMSDVARKFEETAGEAVNRTR